jgi:GR25 family glycosyltransferase involved in LPS biosynthesis
MIQFYCINLQRRPDRWESASKEFKNHGLDVKRWNAVDSLEFGIKPQMACTLSHVLLMKYAYIVGLDEVVVFEDDVVLAAGFWNLLVERIAESPANMRFLSLHSYKSQERESLGKICIMFDNPFGTHGYYARREAIKAISEISLVDRCVEDCLFSTVRSSNMHTYGIDLQYTMAFQNGIDSDIPETAALGEYRNFYDQQRIR